MQKPLVIDNGVVDIHAYDQHPTSYTDDILGNALNEQHPGFRNVDGLQIDIKRFRDVQVGDTLYSINVDKLIEYKVLDIKREEVEVIRYYGPHDNKRYGKRMIVTYTYKAVKGGKVMQFSLFDEIINKNFWTGFDRWVFGLSPNDDNQLFPNTLETGTCNKVFSCKEGARFYLQRLYENRMYTVRELKQKMDIELGYANEYLPVLEKLGWTPKNKEV